MKDALTVLAALGVAGGCLIGAARLVEPINEQRDELDLRFADGLNQINMPPEMAVTQAALGTFRGVAVNVLWQRAERLKQEGKFYEAVQLSRWISQLQPRFPKVWEFLSWNLAYNISVQTKTPEERWLWVSEGIDLLRQKGGGIEMNPNSLDLYRQVGWILLHKVGEFQDNMNWYYKQQFAQEWHVLLGEPRVSSMEAYRQWFQPIVMAPRTRDGLSPEAQRLLDWADNWAASQQTAGGRQRILAEFTIPVPSFEQREAGETIQPSQMQPRQQWPDWASQETIDELVAFLRADQIRADPRNMEPAKMLEVAERFGPLDWRHPASHALYWTHLGFEHVEEIDPERDVTGSQTVARRNYFMALQQLARGGRVSFDPTTGYVSYFNDFRFELAYDNEFQRMKQLMGAERFERSFGSGYRNRIDQAITNAYWFGNEETARQLYERMRERYRGTPYGDRYNRPLEVAIAENLSETLENPDQVRSFVQGNLVQNLVNRYFLNNPEAADTSLARARRIHGQYRTLHPEPASPLYQEMPSFENMQADAVAQVMLINPGHVAEKSLLWNNVDERIRQTLWGRPQIMQQLYSEAYMLGYDAVKAYPPPAGVQLPEVNVGAGGEAPAEGGTEVLRQ